MARVEPQRIFGANLAHWRTLGDGVEQWRGSWDPFTVIVAYDPHNMGAGRWHWQIDRGDRTLVEVDCTERTKMAAAIEAVLWKLGVRS